MAPPPRRVPPSPFRKSGAGALSFGLSKKIGPHKYGCVMAPVPEEVRNQIVRWSASIADVHLAEEGREKDSHVTIKYGFVDSSPKTIQQLRGLLANLGAIKVQLADSLSVFPDTGDGEVLKIGVSSAGLRELNSRLSHYFPCVDKHPVYKPHLTVAYLQPGRALLYKDLQPDFLGAEFFIESVVWSGADKHREVIPLCRPGSGTKAWHHQDHPEAIDMSVYDEPGQRLTELLHKRGEDRGVSKLNDDHVEDDADTGEKAAPRPRMSDINKEHTDRAVEDLVKEDQKYGRPAGAGRPIGTYDNEYGEMDDPHQIIDDADEDGDATDEKTLSALNAGVGAELIGAPCPKCGGKTQHNHKSVWCGSPPCGWSKGYNPHSFGGTGNDPKTTVGRLLERARNRGYEEHQQLWTDILNQPSPPGTPHPPIEEDDEPEQKSADYPVNKDGYQDVPDPDADPEGGTEVFSTNEEREEGQNWGKWAAERDTQRHREMQNRFGGKSEYPVQEDGHQDIPPEPPLNTPENLEQATNAGFSSIEEAQNRLKPLWRGRRTVPPSPFAKRKSLSRQTKSAPPPGTPPPAQKKPKQPPAKPAQKPAPPPADLANPEARTPPPKAPQVQPAAQRPLPTPPQVDRPIQKITPEDEPEYPGLEGMEEVAIPADSVRDPKKPQQPQPEQDALASQQQVAQGPSQTVDPAQQQPAVTPEQAVDPAPSSSQTQEEPARAPAQAPGVNLVAQALGQTQQPQPEQDALASQQQVTQGPSQPAQQDAEHEPQLKQQAVQQAISTAVKAGQEILADPDKTTPLHVKQVGDALLALNVEELRSLRDSVGQLTPSSAEVVQKIKQEALQSASAAQTPQTPASSPVPEWAPAARVAPSGPQPIEVLPPGKMSPKFQRKAKSGPKVSQARVVMNPGIHREEADEMVRLLFEAADSPEDGYRSLASIVGAPDEADVTIVQVGRYKRLFIDDRQGPADGVRIKVDHPAFDRYSRFIGIDEMGKSFIRNEILEIKPAVRKQQKGLGREIFTSQVEFAEDAGFEYIITHAAGSPSDILEDGPNAMNGYYTWPVFGYNETLEEIEEDNEDLANKIRQFRPDAESVMDIILTPEMSLTGDQIKQYRNILAGMDHAIGRPVKERKIITGKDWWLAEGDELQQAKFDLRPGSWSHYLLRLGAKVKNG